MRLLEKGRCLSTCILYRIMFISMLGLMLATALLALKTVSEPKAVLVPVPVRKK
jgi:hypothetical protein